MAEIRGSLKFIRRLVSARSELLDRRLQEAGTIPPGVRVCWVSPREDDHWAEYRDAKFLARVGRHDLAADLRLFWPSRGPRWDALGIAGQIPILVEAKAHVGEFTSHCAASSQRSMLHIARSLEATRLAMRAGQHADWMRGYYQLANRLAHLRFLQDHGADARLVLLCFTGDTQMPTPSTRAAFQDAFAVAMRHLGLDTAPPVNGVVHIYVDVKELQ